MEKENKRIKQNKNNRRLHVNRMYLKLFGILFILILLPLVSSVTYGDVNSIYSDFTWVDYDDANVEINYGGIDFTYGDSNNIVGYIRPTISSGLNSSLLFGVGSSSSISTILSLIGSTGRVGIGTTTPNWILSVNDATNGFAVDTSGNVVQGGWASDIIADAYITKTGAWTGTFDGNNCYRDIGKFSYSRVSRIYGTSTKSRGNSRGIGDKKPNRSSVVRRCK